MKWGQPWLMYPCWQNQIQFVVDVLLPNKILCYTTRLATTGKTKSTPLNMVIISTHPTCDPHFSSARRKPHTTILLIWSELKFEFLLNGFRKWKSFLLLWIFEICVNSQNLLIFFVKKSLSHDKPITWITIYNPS